MWCSFIFDRSKCQFFMHACGYTWIPSILPPFHLGNFVEAVSTSRISTANSEITEIHLGFSGCHHAGNMLQLPNLRPGELLRAGAWRIKNHHYCSQAKASVWRSEGDGVLACGIQRWPRLISKAKLLNVYHVTSVDVSGLMVIHGIRHDCAMVPTTWDEQITFEREVNRNRLFLRACTRNNHDNCNSIW